MKPAILTAGGTYFNFLIPDQSKITLSDIAHGLSHLCRFAGHTHEFYSVAQHSVLVSLVVEEREPEHALAALLHDAAEAYLGDITRPLKALLPEYRVLEKKVEWAIAARFGLPEGMPAIVKAADLCLLATEKRDLMPANAEQWALLDNVACMAERIEPLYPLAARQLFHNRYNELITGGETCTSNQPV